MIVKYLILIVPILLNIPSVMGQTEGENLQDEVLHKIRTHEKDSSLVFSDSNRLIWYQIDTFKFVGYTSAIRGVRKHDTIEISLKFESNWSDSLILATKFRNTRLIEKHKLKFVHYMDSIDWRGYKISRSWFESKPVLFLRMNHPRVFNEDEYREIRSIRRCPDFLVGNIGVFLEHSHVGIDPPNIEDEFIEKLRFISKDVFQMEEIIFDDKIYD